jgi:hypothetical protein
MLIVGLAAVDNATTSGPTTISYSISSSPSSSPSPSVTSSRSAYPPPPSPSPSLPPTAPSFFAAAAHDLAERWLRSNYQAFNSFGDHMFEKYDATRPGNPGGGGE